ncbi:hypothetical protein ATY76_22395 [Rhizobium sp. R339]|nr:hypothetical protein ATY76_22395 [Rhizobium sp. R339]
MPYSIGDGPDERAARNAPDRRRSLEIEQSDLRRQLSNLSGYAKTTAERRLASIQEELDRIS